jgi:hypothetical protein
MMRQNILVFKTICLDEVFKHVFGFDQHGYLMPRSYQVSDGGAQEKILGWMPKIKKKFLHVKNCKN